MTLAFVHGILLITLHILTVIGFLLERRRDRKALKQQRAGEAKVSVLIPVHNESERIEGLLRTLLVQSHNAEIIFIDDRSADKTPDLLAQFADDAKRRGINCRIITLKENPGPNCKQYALSKGITEASGDYFLFTDGDCEAPVDWVQIMVSLAQEGKTGAVIGPVFKKKQGKGFFYLYQCYDHAVRYNYLAGAAGLGAAGGGFGNNLIVSRKALEACGGYDAVPSSPTEDAALISKIREMGEYRIRAACNPEAAVFTQAEKTWLSFINQTLRWNNGGLFSPEALTRFNYNLLMIIIAAGILVIPLLPFFPFLWPMSAGVFVSMIINTIVTFGFFRSKMPKGRLLIMLGYFFTLLFMPVYLTLMTLMGYAGIKPRWKNKVNN
jgi:cellulose synthase/poly-beta-1,6-N-acetylglucosamine synthase-like glycosyltransferase